MNAGIMDIQANTQIGSSGPGQAIASDDLLATLNRLRSLNVYGGAFWVEGDEIHLKSAGTLWIESTNQDTRIEGRITTNGLLMLAGAPTQDNQAATKQYVTGRSAGLK